MVLLSCLISSTNYTAILSSSAPLESLNISRCTGMRGMHKKHGAHGQSHSEPMQSLRSLDVTGCDIQDDALDSILQRCPNLRVLHSAEMKAITVRFVTQESVPRLCTNIEEWNLSMCKSVNDVFLKAITTGCPKLRVLNLSGCNHVRSSSSFVSQM